MDVREQLRNAAPAEAPSADEATRIYRRGRVRLQRRRVAGAAAAAALVVGVVVAWPGSSPDGPVVDDTPGVVGTPDEPSAPDLDPVPDDPSTDGATGGDGGPIEDPTTEDPTTDDGSPPGADEPDDAGSDEEPGASGERVEIGDVVLTVPEGVELRRTDTGPVPCASDVDVATVTVFDALSPEPPPACAERAPVATSVAIAPASTVPPAMLPGHADVDGEMDVEDVELLGTEGSSERFTRSDGTEAVSYYFAELDLYLEVSAPDLDPSLIEDLLASAERRDG